MKPIVRYHPIDKYRQWIVYCSNSMTYFATWEEAISYVLGLHL